MSVLQRDEENLTSEIFNGRMQAVCQFGLVDKEIYSTGLARTISFVCKLKRSIVRKLRCMYEEKNIDSIYSDF